MQKSIFAKIFPIVIVVLSAIIAGKGLLHPGLPPTHDGEYHVIRFYEFDKVLRAGDWYPRWAPDLNKGYGVPLFNYVYPLPNYIASVLHVFGVSFIDAFKLNMFIALIAGAVFMYLWAGSFWGIWGGIVSSIFYTFAPYHLLDIYIRGSVGEVWALSLFPAFLWAVTRFVSDREKHFLPIASIFLALIIFSHNILALMFFPFAISYVGFLIWKGNKGRTWSSILIFLLGIGLSAIFWLPAIFERGYVRGLDVFDYKRHFVELHQLLIPSWGSGFSADVATEGLSFQIGIANLLVLFLSIIFLAKLLRGKDKKIVIFILSASAISIILMLPLSLPAWERVPLMQYVQFPWRFLSLVILCLSFLAGSMVRVRPARVLGIAFIFLPILLGLGYTVPPYYHMRDDTYYITRPNFIAGTNSPGNTFNTIWFNTSLSGAEKLIEDMGEGIRVNTAYFPGWQVFINGEKVKTEVDKDGLIQAERPHRGGLVEVRLLDAPVRAAAKSISLVSFLVFCLLLLKNLSARMRGRYDDSNRRISS